MAKKPVKQLDPNSLEFAEKCIDDPVFFAREVLGVNPWPVQEQILYSLRDNPRTLVQACHASGKCLAPDDLVTLADGSRVPARDLVGLHFRVRTLLPDGTPILADAGADWNETEDVYAVTTETGKRIVRNAAHPLWAADGTFPSGNRCKIDPIGWTSIAGLSEGDLVAVPEECPTDGHNSMDEDELKILAYLIGDGGMTSDTATFTQMDGAQLDEFRSCVESLGATLQPTTNKYGYVVRGDGTKKVGSNPVLNLIRAHGLYGKHSRDKFIPDVVFSLEMEKIALFLSRLYSTDGWASLGKNNVAEIGFCSCSGRLVRDIQDLLIRFGVHGRIVRRPKVNAWTLVINAAHDIARFVERIGIFGKEEAVNRVSEAVATKLLTRQVRKWRWKNARPGTRWERIVSIEKVSTERTVAICVPGHETFVTSFFEHNSFVASVGVVWFMITRGPCVVFSTAPTGRQVKTVLWKEIHSRLQNAKIQLPGRTLQIEWQISHDHFAFGFSTSTPDGFQGIHSDNVLGIFDEASGIHPDIWEAAEGNLSTMGSHFLAIGNPLDPASEFYRKAHRDPRVKPLVISAYDTPHFYMNGITEEDIFQRSWRDKFDETKAPWKNLCHPGYAQDMYDSYGDRHAAYIVRVRGEFPTSAENALIPFWAIQQAQERWTERPKDCEVFNPEDTKIGLDVADTGSDLSASCVAQGGYVHRIRTHPTHDPIETAEAGLEDFLEFEAKVIKVDAIGVGAGTVAYYRKTDVPHAAVNVGQKSRFAKKFRNLKAEGWWHLRQLFIDGKIAIPPDDRMLEEELMNMQMFHTETGLIQLELKEHMKDRIGRSPDRADALMLAFIDWGSYSIADGDADLDPIKAAREQFAVAVEEQKTSVVAQTMETYFRQALKKARRR